MAEAPEFRKIKPLYDLAYEELWAVGRRHIDAIHAAGHVADQRDRDGASACLLLAAALSLALQSGQLPMLLDLLLKTLSEMPGVRVHRIDVVADPDPDDDGYPTVGNA